MQNSDQIFEQLAEPFHPKRVHWRIGSTNAKSLGVKTHEATMGMPLAYIDARDVMERLDGVVGPVGWQDEYSETPSGRVICSLRVLLPIGERTSDWITKSDGAGDTGTEGEKGAISDAFKRAAVKFGIGRYLYSINSGWIDLEKGKIPRSWDGAKFLPTFRPSIYNRWRNFTDALMEHSESILIIKIHLDADEIELAKAEYQAIPNDDLMAMNLAWTKGGVFTTEQNAKINQW